MGWSVAVLLSFPCQDSEPLRRVAQTLLEETLGDSSYTSRMCQALIDNTEKYILCGNKGCIFSWGGVWNYYNEDIEIPLIKRLLAGCWSNSGDNGIMLGFERALLVVNPEQSSESRIYEFSLPEGLEENPWEATPSDIIVKQETAQFCWNQY